jgi:hypothetical protein
MALTAVENALQIIRFGSPEWIPVTMPIYNVSFHGSQDEPYVHGAPPRPHRIGETRTDIWGVVTHKLTDQVGGTHKTTALPTPDKLRSYRWPNPDDDWICGKIYRQAKDFPGGDQWISGGHGPLIWEIAYPLIGMENLLEYFYTEPAFVKDVFDHIAEFHLGLARHYVKVGVRSVGFSDDLAMQTGPFFSAEILEEFFKPVYRRVFDFYRQQGILTGQHCDGNVAKLLDFFIEIGLDILNPVQVSANDHVAVRRKTQGKLCLHGGIGNIIVTNGPVAAIEDHVRQTLWTLGRHGGYFPAVDHSMPTPDAHRQAVVAAIEKWGRYPLQPPVDDYNLRS